MGSSGKKPQTLLIPIYSTTMLYDWVKDHISRNCVVVMQQFIVSSYAGNHAHTTLYTAED